MSDAEGVESLTLHGTRRTHLTFADRFEESGVLGEGTFGLVKRCVERETGREFAVKRMVTRDEETLSNLRTEFQHLVKLRHPNVVQVHELLIDSANGTVHLLMELFRGQELFHMLAEVGRCDGGLTRNGRQTPLPPAPLRGPLPPQKRCHPPRPEAQQYSGRPREGPLPPQNHRLQRRQVRRRQPQFRPLQTLQLRNGDLHRDSGLPGTRDLPS